MIDWQINPDPDAEYGSKIAQYKGYDLEIFSDRDGERWGFSVDDEIIEIGVYDTENEVKQAAIEYVDEWS